MKKMIFVTLISLASILVSANDAYNPFIDEDVASIFCHNGNYDLVDDKYEIVVNILKNNKKNFEEMTIEDRSGTSLKGSVEASNENKTFKLGNLLLEISDKTAFNSNRSYVSTLQGLDSKITLYCSPIYYAGGA
ncbi:hypothetical protein K2X05_03905 [bacterium]|nr:hypothetical protein [bacterium]